MTELERLRRAFRSSCSDSGDDHPDEETWCKLASDELSAAEKSTVLDHVLTCPRCADVHQALLEVRSGAHDFDAQAPKPATRGRRGQWLGLSRMWFLSGALATAAGAIVLSVAPIDWTGTSRSRAPGTDHVMRSAAAANELQPAAPIGVVRSEPAEFSWHAPETATVFVVELLDGDGELVWSSDEVNAPSASWPTDINLDDGRYYWRVHSYGLGPEAEQESELVTFELRVRAR